jgi:hypothetical protein
MSVDTITQINQTTCDINSTISINQINDITKTYLNTTFFRTIPFDRSDAEVWGPQFNYLPYNIWCLKRNLEPIFFSLNLTFELKSFNIDNKMNICVLPKKDDSFITMSDTVKFKLQTELNFVCSSLYNLCLLYDPSTDDKIFPTDWVLNVFKYLNVDTENEYKFINGKLYLKLNENTDYDRKFDKAYTDLTTQLADLYSNGVINCSLNFAEKWDMIEYKKGLFLAKWKDERITLDNTKFLLNLYRKKFTIINTFPDPLLKHILSKSIKIKMIFDSESGTIKIYPGDISDIYNILKIVDLYKSNTIKYTLFTKMINDESEFYKYCKEIKDIYPNSDCMVYRISNNNFKFICSVVVYEIIVDMNEKLSKLLS